MRTVWQEAGQNQQRARAPFGGIGLSDFGEQMLFEYHPIIRPALPCAHPHPTVWWVNKICAPALNQHALHAAENTYTMQKLHLYFQIHLLWSLLKRLEEPGESVSIFDEGGKGFELHLLFKCLGWESDLSDISKYLSKLNKFCREQDILQIIYFWICTEGKIKTALYWSLATIRKYHRVGGLKNGKVFSHSSRG